MRASRGNSVEEVYQKLKNAIRKRYIRQGSQLVEGSLATKLGVSRTPIRGAIKKLETEGLVTSIPNRGAFVVTPTLKEIEETFFVRGKLEQAAVQLACRRITPKQVERLNGLIAEENIVFARQDLDRYYVINDTLHSLISEFSGNLVLASYIKELLDKTRIYLILFDPFLKLTISPSLASHQEIVDALSDRDVERATRAVAQHINNSVEDLETAELMPEDYISI